MPERILDALSAAANGEPFTHMIDGLLPCVPPSGEDVRSLVEALENCAALAAPQPNQGSGCQSNLAIAKEVSNDQDQRNNRMQ